MLFAPRDASVIEFPTVPNLNRCFGYMARALGLDYWMVPQVRARFAAKYEFNSENVAAVVRLVRHILTTRGLDRLLQHRDEL